MDSREYEFYKKIIFKFLIKLSFKICNKCVAVSNDLKEELIKEKWVNKNKIVTIYNPVIQDEFNGKIRTIEKGQEINLAIVGWIWDIKNQEEAIKAIHQLNDNRYKLHIIGGIKDKKYYDNLVKLIKDLNLEGQVIFEGIKKDIFKELEKIDILLLTSKTEALPTVIIEALACGIPVIASNCEVGPREILDCGKFGFICDDNRMIPKYIDKLVEDKDRYKELSYISMYRAKEFTYSRAVNKYTDLINNLN